MVPPTSMCTGAVYLEAAATLGMPASLADAYELMALGVCGVGDDVLSVGEVAGDRLGDNNLMKQ